MKSSILFSQGKGGKIGSSVYSYIYILFCSSLAIEKKKVGCKKESV